MPFTSGKISRAIAILCMAAVLFVSTFAYAPLQARAQGLTVPIGTMFNFHSIMDNLKNFTLDRLAVMVANQILQRMTASIVNWINTGFEGSPAFLTDPEGFFLDVGDQITGQFLQEIGAPTALCSPFSLDIRLSLALSQAYGYGLQNRYTCTLGKMIQETRNAIDRGASLTIDSNPNGLSLDDILNPVGAVGDGDVLSINNSSVSEFLHGDFRQGGWPTFVALSMQQQNNPNGAWLQSEADIMTQINARKQRVNTDLNRGMGFMSWEKCNDVTDYVQNNAADLGEFNVTADQQKQVDAAKDASIVTGKTDLGQVTGFRKKYDAKTGQTKYQSCETQTPGSLIGGSIQRQMNVPTDKLVLVKTISDSIDAMLGALVNQMLTQGLAALSNQSSGGGGGRSYVQLLVDEANNPNSQVNRSTQDRLSTTLAQVTQLTGQYIAVYDEAIQLLTQTRGTFLAARSCFVTKKSKLTHSTDRYGIDPYEAQVKFADEKIAAIDAIIATSYDPALRAYSERKQDGQNKLAEIRAAAASTNATSTITNQSADDIRAQTDRLDSYVDSVSASTRLTTDQLSSAQQELARIKQQVSADEKKAKEFQEACDDFPSQY